MLNSFSYMNIANQLTVARIILACLCVWLTIAGTPASLRAALFVFICAAITDFFDGYVARKYQLISALGKILDPIADKVLILGVFAAFVYLGAVNIWAVLLIALRECVVTGIRLCVLNRGIVLEAKTLGKYKTVAQIAGIIIIFISVIAMRSHAATAQGAYTRSINFFYYYVIPVCMWGIAGITVVSGVHFIWANRRLRQSNS